VSLKPQDVCVLLKIVALERAPWSYSQLAYELGMSASEVHAGVKRALEASLLRLDEGWGYPDAEALCEFLVHGLKYVFTPVRGGITLGIPTAHAALPLSKLLPPTQEAPPVWPDPGGSVRGVEFSPLYKSVPRAAQRDARLYELLALVDAIRGGQGKAHDTAVVELRARLGLGGAQTQTGRTAQAALKPTQRGHDGTQSQRVHGRRH
jgi:hypothetical protein